MISVVSVCCFSLVCSQQVKKDKRVFCLVVVLSCRCLVFVVVHVWFGRIARSSGSRNTVAISILLSVVAIIVMVVVVAALVVGTGTSGSRNASSNIYIIISRSNHRRFRRRRRCCRPCRRRRHCHRHGRRRRARCAMAG